MGVGAVFVFLPAAILGGIGSELGTAGTIVSALIGAAAGLLFYKLTMMLIARRQTPELAVRGFAGEMLLGLAIGTGVIGTSFLTGDDFGTEGSIVPVFPGLSLAVFMLTAAHRRRKNTRLVVQIPSKQTLSDRCFSDPLALGALRGLLPQGGRV